MTTRANTEVAVRIRVRIRVQDEASGKVGKITQSLARQNSELGALSRRYKEGGQSAEFYTKQLGRAAAIDQAAAGRRAKLTQQLRAGTIATAKAQTELASLARTQAGARQSARNLASALDRLAHGKRRSFQATQAATRANQSWMTGLRSGLKLLVGYNIAQAAMSRGTQAISGSIDLASRGVEAFTKNIELFGAQNARQIQNTGENAARIAGMNKVLYDETIGTMGAFLQAAGNTEEQSLHIAQSVTQRISDIASFYNQSIEETTNKIQSVLAGTGPRPGYALGIDTTIKSMQEFMQTFDQFRGKVWADISLAEKQELRFHKIMQDTQKTHGDFVRTSDGFANTARTGAANVENMGAAIGTKLVPPAQAMLNIFNSWFTSEHEEGQAKFLQNVEATSRHLSEIADLPKTDTLVQLAAFFQVLEESSGESGMLTGAMEFIDKLVDNDDRIKAAQMTLAEIGDSLKETYELDNAEQLDAVGNLLTHIVTLGIAGQGLNEMNAERREAIRAPRWKRLKDLGLQSGIQRLCVRFSSAHGSRADHGRWACLKTRPTRWFKSGLTRRHALDSKKRAVEDLIESTREEIEWVETAADTKSRPKRWLRRTLESRMSQEATHIGLLFEMTQAELNAQNSARATATAYKEASIALQDAGIDSQALRDDLINLADRYDIKLVVDGEVSAAALEAMKVALMTVAINRYMASGQDIMQMNMQTLAIQEGEKFRSAFGALGSLGIDTALTSPKTQKRKAEPKRTGGGGGGSDADPFGGPKGEKWEAGRHGQIKWFTTPSGTRIPFQYNAGSQRWQQKRASDFDGGVAEGGERERFMAGIEGTALSRGVQAGSQMWNKIVGAGRRDWAMQQGEFSDDAQADFFQSTGFRTNVERAYSGLAEQEQIDQSYQDALDAAEDHREGRRADEARRLDARASFLRGISDLPIGIQQAALALWDSQYGKTPRQLIGQTLASEWVSQWRTRQRESERTEETGAGKAERRRDARAGFARGVSDLPSEVREKALGMWDEQYGLGQHELRGKQLASEYVSDYRSRQRSSARSGSQSTYQSWGPGQPGETRTSPDSGTMYAWNPDTQRWNKAGGGSPGGVGVDQGVQTWNPETGRFESAGAAATPAAGGGVVTSGRDPIIIHGNFFLEDGRSVRAYFEEVATEVIGR